jgi:hypothetical protein
MTDCHDLIDHLRERQSNAAATLQVLLESQRPHNERAQALLTAHQRPGLGQEYLQLALDWVEELLAQNKALKLMGANRAAVDAAMRSYWGEEGLQPAWRQQQEVYDFGRALHAAVAAVLKEGEPVPQPAHPQWAFTYPSGFVVGDRIRVKPAARKRNAQIVINPTATGVVVMPEVAPGGVWPSDAVQVRIDGGQGMIDAHLLERVP